VLTDLIRISAPDGVIAVKGIAKKVQEPRTYGDHAIVYGELVLGAALVSFAVPAECAPREDQPVIIEGHLRFKLATRSSNDVWRGNWKVTLVGQVVGEWTPIAAPTRVVPLPERGESIPLSTFVLNHGVEPLVVLSSHIGHRDLAQSLSAGKCQKQPRFIQANFGNSAAFLQALDAIPTDGSVRGLAVVRGGGGGLDVIAGSREVVAALLRKGLPFYTALGHDTDVSLADRSADQVFHSPSELGAAIARAAHDADELIKQHQRLNAQAGLLDRQKTQLADQASQIALLEAHATRAMEKANARAGNLRNMLIVASLLIVALIWLLVRRGS
jgi:exodeoxyribonuclease VII large subunit